MIKYIISTTARTGEFWARKLDLNLDEIKFIVNVNNARGIDFTEENTLILLGKEYDYPESNPNVSEKARDEFYEVLSIVKRRISINTRAEQFYSERNR